MNSKLPQEVAKKYLRWCILAHLDAAGKVDIISDFGIRIGGDSFYTANLVPLYLVWDLDKTFTAEDSNTVYKEYNDILCSLNPKIDRKHRTLEKCIEEIDSSPSDFSKPQERYDATLRKCGFTKDQHTEASIRTGESKNIKIIPYSHDAILEQYKMNCLPAISTGSPKDAATEVSKRQIGISEDFIEGSIPLFDKNGKFVRFLFNLGTNKAVSMSNFYQKSHNCYCDCSFLVEPELARKVYVTDDIFEFDRYVVAKVGSQLGIVLYVGEEEAVEVFKRPGEFVVNAPEIRKDARKIKPYLKLYRRAKIYAHLHSPKEAKTILSCVKEIKRLKYQQDFRRLADKMSKFISLEMLFPVLTTRFKRKLVEFEDEISRKPIDSNIVKRSANDLIETLEENDPIFHVREERGSELNEIVNLLD